ncbi:unnamed protein product [Adineta steineri]|uniref:Uncharacterized protein n=1 Tax=Adineta steineri TaxID=433720 RepID=A0A818LQZ3_9BILA|nr:unnamed protein product [Adineta steineri]
MLNTDYLGANLTDYENQSSDYTDITQSRPITLQLFKHYLENLIEVGYELGLCGLLIFAKELRRKLKKNQGLTLFPDQEAKNIFNGIYQRLECITDDILKNLYQLNLHDSDILFSPKVLQLLDRILKQPNTEDTLGQSIVFVERVYTATILSQVLSHLILTLESPHAKQLKVNHVTGIKSLFYDKSMTMKYQEKTIKEFRSGAVNILIATAVVEEGLDIPRCDLVIRFNKPNNFSSYMQSKGRARAKQNAAYVLFLDELDIDSCQRDQMEYENYEEIEKEIQKGFSFEENDDDLKNELLQIPPYRTSTGVVIDATRAAQLIMDYCVLLGNGQIFPPRFLFHGSSSPYKCILSMPANCPIRDDIICQSKKKKLAKYECCLEMVKKLHQRGEFNEYCLPNRNGTLLKIDIPIENRIFKLVDTLFEKKSDSSFEIFSKSTAIFPIKSKKLSMEWYLYQINNDLGFVVPCQLMKLPKFNIYDHDKEITIQVIYLKSIDYSQYRNGLKYFCKYLFEYVFDNMNIDSILEFNIEQSSFQLIPCLLTKFGDIDWNRMEIIYNRKVKKIQDYNELNDTELYCAYHHENKQYFVNISDNSLIKRASDLWDMKKKSEDIKTYADYFEHLVPNIHINRNTFLATMKGIRKPKINYLKQTVINPKDEANDPSKKPIYFPIEVLHYAPLNQYDFELIYKLPTILIRISQLYRIERLRKLFADNIQSYSLIDVDQMPTVSFNDFLKTNENLSFLPLISLTYDNLLLCNTTLQPSPDILFQAITRRSTDENLDMENLEILGDCFLKLIVSMSLYHRYPLAGAGALTVEKAKQISNSNLYRITVQKKLKAYLNVMKISFRGEEANWLPPGYIIKKTEQNQINNELGSKRYEYQKVKRKAFADMMEAFMGAFLISTNYMVAIQFMKWLGLDVIPLDENKEIMKVPPILCSYLQNEESNRIVEKFYKEQAFCSVEKTINYKFNNKAYLIAAFTHPSSFANRLTNCYERLEFLGDAVLDFLVTRYIFVNDKNITPGRVTDIRQDLSNNGRLAYILVACGLHTKILHNSPDLFGKISVYVGDEELFPKDLSPDSQLNKDIAQWADSTAPKALADVFEALVGAIFLDAGKCLKTVWQVIQPLLQQYIGISI